MKTWILPISVSAPLIFNPCGDGVSSPPVIVAVIPGSGGTLLVEYQLAANGTWTTWPAEAVATKTVYVLTGPVYALRFTAATADGVVEIAQ